MPDSHRDQEVKKTRMRLAVAPRGRAGWIRAILVALSPFVVIAIGIGCMVSMPGKSHQGELPSTNSEEKLISANLQAHVRALAEEIGERNIGRKYSELERAAEYIEERLISLGYRVSSQRFRVEGHDVRNLEAKISGSSLKDQIIVVGAHYDTALATPGANDNGSAVAAMLELARLMKKSTEPARTIRFVAFVNEEPPYFQTEDMGSLRYAERCREREEDIVAMLSLETMGYYTDTPGSQKYPPLISALYPDTGNFIAFVGNVGSRSLVRDCVGLFRESTDFPCEGGALPGWLPGIDWSDHWSFWQHGYHGVMVTDTALFRYPHYHEPEDTSDKIDFDRTARVVAGLVSVLRGLAEG